MCDLVNRLDKVEVNINELVDDFEKKLFNKHGREKMWETVNRRKW